MTRQETRKGFSTVIFLGIGFLVVTLVIASYLALKGTGDTRTHAGVSTDGEVSSGDIVETDQPFFTDKLAREDVSRAASFMSKNERRLTGPKSKPGQTSPTPNAPEETATSYQVMPILFLANDKSNISNYSSAINETMGVIKRWYAGAMEKTGTTKSLNLANVVTYKAPENFDYYKCPDHVSPCGDNYDGIWGNVQDALREAGYGIWDVGKIYLVFVPGAGGWAGAAGCPTNGCDDKWPYPGPTATRGFGILGDWALDGIRGVPNKDCVHYYDSACFKDPQRGAVGHELGHTFGLAHANEVPGSIMSEWWNFPFTSLLEQPGNNEKAVIASSKFFAAKVCNQDSHALITKVPSKRKVGTTFEFKSRIENDGYCHWDKSKVSLNLFKEDVWGVKNIPLEMDIYPSQYFDFVTTLTAPTTPDDYKSLWRVKSGKLPIGDIVGKKIKIIQ